MSARRAGVWVAAMLMVTPSAARAITIAEDGSARATIVVPADPIPAERAAARELASYLEKVTGARFDVRSEKGVPRGARQIHVGPTALALRLGLGPSRLGEEEWAIASEGRVLVLAGGRPRGTLYAVYRFLEDELGVRWWNAWEERTPQKATVRVRSGTRRGRPAFDHRDMSGLQDGPVDFRSRCRLNGPNAAVPWTLGVAETFGTPWTVHSFYYAFPPDRYFDDHPEYYAERAGFRVAQRSQLCLTNPDLGPLLAETIDRFADAVEARSRADGTPAPRLYDFSQNDWGGRCECERCSARAAKEESPSAALVALLNDAADRVRDRHPGILLETLAYTWTFRPPLHVAPRDNVLVRFSAYGNRDVTRAVVDERNRVVRDTLAGWKRITRHLWVWDYGVVFLGNDRGLPIPSHRNYAPDLRFYRDQGIEGVFVQHEFPIAGDLRDLKVWLYAKLLEDPDRDPTALIREFTDGFYGAAARPVRRYLRLLEETVERSPARITDEANPEAFTYLNLRFLAAAQAIFDRAENAVLGNLVLERRVRHARLSVDYATLVFWRRLEAEAASEHVPMPMDRLEVARRYRQTWLEQIELRGDPARREALRGETEAEIAELLAE